MWFYKEVFGSHADLYFHLYFYLLKEHKYFKIEGDTDNRLFTFDTGNNTSSSKSKVIDQQQGVKNEWIKDTINY